MKNTGFYSDTYTFTCQGSSGVTCSSFTPTSKTLISSASVTVTATYATGGTPGTGRLQLTATSINSQDVGYYSVPIVRYGVSVTPDGVADTSRTTNTSGYARRFTVTNTGSGQNTYTLTCSGSSSPVVTCGTVSPSSLTLGTGALDSASVSYGVGAVGTGTLTLSAAGTSATDNGSYSIPIVAAAVQVTPPPGTAGPWLVNSTGHTATFTVQNTGTARNTYTLTCGGTDVSCTNVNPASTTLNAGATTQPTVTYNAGASAGTGTVTLTATGGATATGTGSVAIVTASQQGPVVAAGDASPGANVERSLCLTIAMGQAAAAECGDLRVVHALPTTKTMNKARTPTLLYNSQFAHPYPLVALNVTLPATAVVPDSVRAVVKINSVARDSAAWVGSQWSQGQTRRIALAWDGLGDATGVYTFTVEVRNKYLSPANQLLTTFSGTIAVVNRSTSAFGAGWWLAGVEHLNVSNMMWVSGDGSVRQYQSVSTNVWAAPNVDHPDTLRKDAVTGNYTRYDRDSLRVVFDPTGQHITTVNRQGHTTSLTWTSGRLSTITLPVSSGPSKTYQFAYDANAKLQTVTSPAGTGTRTTTVTVTSGQVMSIRDPDNTTVQFAYSPSVANAMSSRTDRRGTVTSYSYDTGKRLSQSSINMGGSQPAIVAGLTALETRGFQGGSSVDTALAYAKLDGPRTDLADTTLFWLDPLGAPRRIVDALGNVTRIDRTDSHWPALATSVTDPTGFQVTATYDALRGSLLTSIQVNALGDGRNDTTTYAWHPKWDELVKIRQPEGETDTLSYDAVGNRLWQRDARGASSEVDFGYNAANLLTSITLPGTPAQQIRYDAMGNLDTVKTPRGYLTTYQNDGAGRDTSIATQVDTLNPASAQVQQLYLDAADRDTLSITTGAGGAPTVSVHKYFTNGLADSLSRWSSPDAASIGRVTTRWKYDAVGRTIVEIAPGSDQTKRDSTVYDPASNATARFTRRVFAKSLQPITMTYDALNRVSGRTIPTDSYASRPSGVANGILNALDSALDAYTVPAEAQAFTYDPMERPLTANNPDAQVTRTYYPNGLLQTETLRIADSARSNFTQHVYTTTSSYDRDGRRKALTVPTQFRPTPQQTQVLFGYNAPAFGPLTSTTDLQGNQYTFQYNPRAELQAVVYPASYVQAYGYDPDGRLAADTVRNTGTAGAPRLNGPIVRSSAYVYDAQGRVLQRTDPAVLNDTLRLSYSGLGQLVTTNLSQHGLTPDFGLPWTYADNETFGYDGLGNRTRGITNSVMVIANVVQASPRSNHVTTYESATGRLVLDTDSATTTGGQTAYSYDADGAEQYSLRLAINGAGAPQERASFYGVDGRLRRVDWRWAASASEGSVPWKELGEDYRYDALGRRVWTQATKTCSLSFGGVEQAECKTSLVRRTVWDGSQELGEIQMPFGQAETDGSFTPVSTITGIDGLIADPNPWLGQAVYLHALTVDQPLAITRLNFVEVIDPNPFNPPYGGPITKPPLTVAPFWTAQGDAPVGVFMDGYAQECNPPGSGLQCANVPWLLYWSAYDRQHAIWNNWWGTLLQGKQDKSGLQYRRNRFYDPATGRFTQEDPVGLAGGLNAYGFAKGDPVNYSDPFGLCDTAKDPTCAFVNALGGLLQPAQGPLEVMGSLAIAPLGAPAGAAGGISAEVLELGNTLGTSVSGLLRAGGVATRVADAVGGTVSALRSSEGYRVTVDATRNIVARIKATGDMRVSIDGIGSLTREGIVSVDRALTHLKNLPTEEIVNLIAKAKEFLAAPK